MTPTASDPQNEKVAAASNASWVVIAAMLWSLAAYWIDARPAHAQAGVQATEPGLRPFAETAGRALGTHADIASKLAGYRAQVRAFEAAGASRLPRVDLSAQAGPERVHGLGLGSVVQYDGTGRRTTVVLRQPVYDGGEIDGEAERQGRLGNVRLHELRAAEDTVLLELARAWIDVLRQRDLIAIARDSLANHERLLELVGSRVRSGLSRGVDFDQASARVSSARLALSADEGALREAVTRFERTAGQTPAARLPVFELPRGPMPADEAEAIERALASAPSVQSARESAGAVAAELRVRRSAFSPKAAIEARHDLDARTATLPNAASSSLVLALSFNVFAGGGDALRERDAALRYEAARQQFRDALAIVRQSVGAAWAESLRQTKMAASATDYAESVKRARELYQSQYDIGQRSLLDLLNSEAEVAQARRLVVGTRFDALTAQARLLSLTGRLPETIGVERTPADPLLRPSDIDAGALTLAPELERAEAGATNPQAFAAAVAVPAAVLQATAPAVAPLRPVPAEPVTLDATGLPAGLGRAVRDWATALQSGRPGATLGWYPTERGLVGDLRGRVLAESIEAAGDEAADPRVLRIERIDAQQGVAPNRARQVQFSVLTTVRRAGAAPKYLNTAQLWTSEGTDRWMIRRERTIAVSREPGLEASSDAGAQLPDRPR
jgi:adhesin transport system outer membrane protein